MDDDPKRPAGPHAERGLDVEGTTDKLIAIPHATLLRGLAERLNEIALVLPSGARKVREVAPLMPANLARAARAGVPIAFGADVSSPAPHGTNAKEFALMVRAGLSPMQAIVAATDNAAKLLGRQGQLGRVAPGAYADLIAVSTDPLRDPRALERVNFVMKGGTILER